MPLHARGSQGALAAYNERVLLHAVRLHGALPATELARATGLTAQAVSLISRRLLAAGLLAKGAPQRGRVGQPSVPLQINPGGAFAVGVKLGRRSLDVLLVDLLGQVRQRWHEPYAHADPRTLLPRLGQLLQDARAALPAAQRARVCGVGLAAPLNPGGWQALLGLPRAASARWQQVDLQAALQQASPWPVTLVKDTAAACLAELSAGRGRELHSFLYVFVDTLVGGGLVLHGQLHAGASGNAGAVGSLPLTPPRPSGAAPAQLLSVASLLGLEQAFSEQRLAVDAAYDDRALQPPWRPHTRRWLAQAGAALAQAVQSAACVLDVPHVVVDGSCSPALLQALLAATGSALDRCNWEGVARPVLLAGAIGSDARALGGALLPLHAAFAPDPVRVLQPGP